MKIYSRIIAFQWCDFGGDENPASTNNRSEPPRRRENPNPAESQVTLMSCSHYCGLDIPGPEPALCPTTMVRRVLWRILKPRSRDAEVKILCKMAMNLIRRLIGGTPVCSTGIPFLICSVFLGKACGCFGANRRNLLTGSERFPCNVWHNHPSSFVQEGT